MDDRLSQASGVVFNANGLFGFAKLDAADTVDFANFRDSEDDGFGGGRSVTVQDIKLGHGMMISAALLYVESRIWGFLWLRVRFQG